MGESNFGFDDDFMASMLGDFLDESHECMEQLHAGLATLEGAVRDLDDGAAAVVDRHVLNEMFRAAHSLKGLSAMLQLEDINRLTHQLENVFEAARSNELPIHARTVEVAVSASDRLASMIDQLRQPHGENVDYSDVIDNLQQLLAAANDDFPADGADGAAAPRDALDAPTISDAAATKPTPSATSSKQPAAKARNDELEEDPFENVSDESDVPVKYLPIFIAESEESLDGLAEQLVGEACDLSIDDLLIVCHRIKGAAASIGLHRPAKLAHYMEDLLQAMRDERRAATPAVADALLECVDALKEYVLAMKSGDPIAGAFTAPYKRLIEAGGEALCAESSESRAAPLDEWQLTEEIRSTVLGAAPSPSASNGPAWLAHVVFEEGLPLVELKARLAYERVAALGAVFYSDPPEAEIEDAVGLRRLTLGVVSDASQDYLHRRLSVEGVAQCDVEMLQDAPQPPTADPALAAATSSAPSPPQPSPTIPATAALPPSTEASLSSIPPAQVDESFSADTPASLRAAASDPARSRAKPTETLRVDIDRLDQLMNLAGQLAINKARFGQIGDRMRGIRSQKQSAHAVDSVMYAVERMLQDSSLSGTAVSQDLRSRLEAISGDLAVVRRDIGQLSDLRTIANDLSEAVHQLDRVSDGIQKSVMDTRMVPIGPLFSRFRRVVRDITRGNGKNIDLEIRGENTELDKRMIDELSDPLIHMIRNAADHGVESPEDRVRAGKSPRGNVVLNAFHRGNRICIQVSDDGRGLDPEKIRAKALEKGVITAADAERLTQQQCFQLIWEPGLSTAEKVTEVSGRGMGMDIVRSKIEQINGSVELDSHVGAGTTITIKLPLTMAILPSLLTTIGGEVFAIPVESVSEIVRVSSQDFATVHGLNTARVRGRVVSVATLEELMHNSDDRSGKRWRPTEATLVVISSDGQELGLIVDDLLGEQDIVIKSLSENYRNVDGIAGASILGDGRVSLILDVSALVNQASRIAARSESEETHVGTALNV